MEFFTQPAILKCLLQLNQERKDRIMTDHVTHLTAKTIRHIFGWTIISTILGGAAAAVVNTLIRNHDYFTMGFIAVIGIFVAGIGLVLS